MLLMDRYLITGFSGFVSYHFLDYLEGLKKQISVLGIDIVQPDFYLNRQSSLHITFEKMDLLDRERIQTVIFKFQPNYILHLASYSSVAFSWANPVMSFMNNTNVFLNVLEAVRSVDSRIRILSVGSSEEYGGIVAGHKIFREDDILNPVSPYAVARVSQEMLSRVYTQGYGLDIVMTRSFNHIGPRQKETFVIASFAKRLVEMKRRGLSSPKLMTGDISQIRDFVDVRDVVRAYDQLLKKGENGEIYNICSGVGYSLSEIIRQMASILEMNVVTEIDQKLIRPSDNKVIIGSNEKIIRDIGWEPLIPLRKSLEDTISDFKKRQIKAS